MNKHIKKIKLSRLWKLELPELANSVIEIVEKHNPETLKIEDFFDLLVEQKPQIELLIVPFGPHPITSEMDSLRKQRRAFARGIINRLTTLEKGGKVNAIQHLKVVKPVVDSHLQNLSRTNNKVTSQRVTQFLQQFKEDAALQTAITGLDMTSYIDDLQSVHKALGEEYGSRRESISGRPNKMTQSFMDSVLTAMVNLFKCIELAQVKNKELDYTPLIDELNIELTSFGTLINARASYYKRKAEEVIIDGNSEEPSEPTQTTNKMPMRSMNVEVEQEDNLNELDKKRTVAVPTKQTRLPDVSTEA